MVIYYVIGNLALSRAIGDFEFKKNVTLPPEEQIITADPDITEHQITEEDEFLVLACDGEQDFPRRIHAESNKITFQVSGTA